MMFERMGKARGAIMATLALAIPATGAVMPASVALAATGGTVTVAKPLGDEAQTTYDIYQVVLADVTQGADNVDKGKRFHWAPGMKDVVVPFLQDQGYDGWLSTNGYTEAVDGVSPAEQPQNAVEFISEMIAASPEAANTSTTPKTTAGASFATELARTLAASSVSPFSTGTELSGAEQGYYLFVTTTGTIDGATAANPTVEVGTAPIWATVKVDEQGSPVDYVVTEKSTKPTLTKEVLDEDGNPTKVVDLNTDETVDFKTTMGLPTNLDAYPHFHLKLEDVIPDGLSLDLDKDGSDDLDGITVTIGDADGATDITSHANISVAVDPDTGERRLVVEFDDLRGVPGVDGQTPLVVRYTERVTDANPLGATGALAGSKMTYTADPSSDAESTIETNAETRVINYELKVTKVDESTRNALENAKFTLQVQGNANEELNGRFIGENGEVLAEGASGFEFTSNESGILEIPHLDEGTYVLHETAAPDGYDPLDSDVTITIVAEKNQTGVALTDLKVTLSGGNLDPNGSETMGAHDANSHDSVADHLDGYLSASAETGIIEIRLSDAKRIELPGTGLTPSNAMMIGGGLLLAAGAVVTIMYRRRETAGLAE